MSNAVPEVVSSVKDWIETSESEQLDALAAAYDPDTDIALRGQSIRLSLSALAAECNDDLPEPVVPHAPDVLTDSVERAVCDAVTQRLPDDESLDAQMDDGWSIEWTEPTDEMHVDITEPLSRHTDDLVAIRGRVRQKTDPVPWFRTRVYKCQRCGTEQRTAILHRPEDIVRGITRAPHECEVEGCKAGESQMETVTQKCDKRDYQYLTVEQAPDADGASPATIPCWVFGEGRLTDGLEGERVTVVGRLRLNPNADPAEHYIEVSSVITEREDDTVDVTDEDREQVQSLVDGMDAPLDTAAENLAPTVHGHDLAKRALTLVAVGSGLEDLDEQTHTLLIGDPGTAKTELTKAVREVVPSTRKASLTQSTDVGLTASAVKETVAGSEEWVIRAGALSLASGGILTVDELDEADFDLSKLNDALSEGEIPVDKAGESTHVRTDTRVIATANPEGAEFDPLDPLDEQIQFTADVVSRFDLAVPFRDDSDDEEMNAGILQATAADYLDEDEMTDEYAQYTRDIDLDTLRKWIAIAQEQSPRLTTEAMDEIHRGWELLREADDGVISIDARRLRAVIRLAHAHARLRLGEKVTPADAKIAFRLVSEMLGEWGYDLAGESNRGSSDEEEDDEPEEAVEDETTDEMSLGEELATPRDELPADD